MIYLTIHDYISFIKKNKLLFFLVFIGLFVISFMSLLLIDTIRSNLFNNIDFDGTTSIAYVYKTPVSSKDVYARLKKVGISNVGIMLVSEQAHNNEPNRADDLLKNGATNIHSDEKLKADNLGIVGYKTSSYYARSSVVHSGRYFNSLDKGKMNCIINESVVSHDNNGTVTSEGYSFEIIGLVKLAEERVPYDSTSVIITPETFAMLDIPLKIIRLQFVIPPTAAKADKILGVLNSFGDYEKTAVPLAEFNISVIVSYFTSSALYLIALCIISSILILVFKCWTSAQQGIYKIYSICGITDRKASIMRKVQVILFYVPTFILASISYITLTLLNYKKYVYTLIPQTFIVNFIVILVILFILTDFQNRKNTGFAALNNL